MTASEAFRPFQIIGFSSALRDPFLFDFYFSPGQESLDSKKTLEDARRLIRYFLAAVTVPDEDLWVNLAPGEEDRVLPDALGRTELGRELAAQDYLLKQLTASLSYPKDDLGKDFWRRVYREMARRFGRVDLPVSQFNRVWIVPDRVSIYEQGTGVVILDSRLKVMLEEDYRALEDREAGPPGIRSDRPSPGGVAGGVQDQAVREVLLPALAREVNEGRQFAALRQVYHAVALAAWFKHKLKDHLVVRLFGDKEKITGLDLVRQEVVRRIYDRYMEAFRKGVYHLIQEERDPVSGRMRPRKYFSGGTNFRRTWEALVPATAAEMRRLPREFGKGLQVQIALTGKRATRRRAASAVSPHDVLVRWNDVRARVREADARGRLLSEEEFRAYREFLEGMNAWQDPRKRLVISVLLRRGPEPHEIGRAVIFPHIDGVRIVDGRLSIDWTILDAVGVLGEGAWFADMDKNLAEREEPLPLEMRRVLHRLAMGGMLAPFIDTDNEIKKAVREDRLGSFPPSERTEFFVAADGSGNLYHYDKEKGTWQADVDYRKRSGAHISQKTFEKIRDSLFQPFLEQLGPFEVALARTLSPFVVQERFPSFDEIDTVIDEVGRHAGDPGLRVEALKGLVPSLTGSEMDWSDFLEYLRGVLDGVAASRRTRPLMTMVERLEGEKDVMRFLALVAVVDTVRILQGPEGKDRDDLIRKFLTLDPRTGLPISDGALRVDFRANVQIAFKPIRTRVVRDMVREIIARRARRAEGSLAKVLGDLVIQSGGSTTINVKRRGVDKSLPILMFVRRRRIPADLILFDGDEMAKGEQDELVVEARQRFPELAGMMVVDTSREGRSGGFVPLAKDIVSPELGVEDAAGPEFNLAVGTWLADRLESEAWEVLKEHREPTSVRPVMAALRAELGFPEARFSYEDYLVQEAKELIAEATSIDEARRARAWEDQEFFVRADHLHHWLERMGSDRARRLADRIDELSGHRFREGVDVEAEASREYKIMARAFDRFIRREELPEEPVYAFLKRRAEEELGKAYSPDRADEAVVHLKHRLARLYRGIPDDNWRKRRVIRAMMHQAGMYDRMVDGFGWVAYDRDKDRVEDLIPLEKRHEEALFLSQQGIDTLTDMGAVSALEDLLALARSGLRAHEETVHLADLENAVESARKAMDGEALRGARLEAETRYHAVRRWLGEQNMLLKAVHQLGVRAGRGSEAFRQANRFLVEILLNYRASGEGFYWLRNQAASRLKDFLTETTEKALQRVADPGDPAGRPPHPDSVFIARNLEAANPKSLSVGLAAGMTLLSLARSRAKEEVIVSPRTFDFRRKHHRFARLAGVLDVVTDADVSDEIRIRILDRVATLPDDEVALAANFFLDALQEMILPETAGEVFRTEPQRAILRDERVRRAAAEAFLRIARAVVGRLQAENPPLAETMRRDLSQVLQAGAVDAKAFRTALQEVHVVLSNLHRLGELKSLAAAAGYVNLKRKLLFGSGGSASLGMAGARDVMTTAPALATIGTHDNGGASLMERAYAALQEGVLLGGFGDHIRFDMETAVAEGVPGARMVKALLGSRFGEFGPEEHVTLRGQMEALFPNQLESARQAGPLEERRFRKMYAELLKIADLVDRQGRSLDFNSIKNLITTGVLHMTGGIGDEFMNPDGIYAGFEYLRRLLGIRSMAVPHTPFGRELFVENAAGEQFIGQSFFSHTPHGYDKERRVILKVERFGDYYTAVPMRSRIAEVARSAPVVWIGMGSWVTSVGVLLKDKAFREALARNPSRDRFLILNPAKDDETRGLSAWESTVTLLEHNMDGMPLEKVVRKILVNNFDHLDRPVLPARPRLGTYRDVLAGIFGMYAGANALSPRDALRLQARGLSVIDTLNMLRVAFKSKRTNPDESVANVIYDPYLMAVALWGGLSDEAKSLLPPPRAVLLIERKEELARLLESKELDWKALGLGGIHDLIFHPDLIEGLQGWLEEGREPEWIRGKRDDETMFQYVWRRAIQEVEGLPSPPSDVRPVLNEEISLGHVNGMDMGLKVVGREASLKAFPEDRMDAAVRGDRQALLSEEWHRLGKIEVDLSGLRPHVTVVLPWELTAFGMTPADRIEALKSVLRFQILKARKMQEGMFSSEASAHEEALKALARDAQDADRLAEASLFVPLKRYLDRTLGADLKPVIFMDMDGTITPSRAMMNTRMQGWFYRYLLDPTLLKKIITGQDFTGPNKQIVEAFLGLYHRLVWLQTRTGESMKPPLTLNRLFRTLEIQSSSGGAKYHWSEEEGGFVLYDFTAMPPLTMKLVELAARMTMPKLPRGYPVEGHQIEYREPRVLADGSVQYSGMAVLPSGRYDSRRDFDKDGTVRLLQGMRMERLLQHPRRLLEEAGRLAALYDSSRRLQGALETWGRVPVPGTPEEFLRRIEDIVDEVRRQDREPIPEDVARLVEEVSQRFRREDGRMRARLLAIDDEDRVHVLPEQIPMIAGLYREVSRMVGELSDWLDRPIQGSHQPGGRTTIDFSPQDKGSTIRIGEGEAGVMIGDELAQTALMTSQGGVLTVDGNDFSVVRAVEEGRLSGFGLLVHVGPHGPGTQLEVAPETVTTYGAQGLSPYWVTHLLGNLALAESREESHRIEGRRLEAALQAHGMSLEAFGVEKVEEIPDALAAEIETFLHLSGGRTASSTLTARSDELNPGGIYLAARLIDWDVRRDPIGRPLPLEEQGARLVEFMDRLNFRVIKVGPVTDLRLPPLDAPRTDGTVDPAPSEFGKDVEHVF